MIKKIPSMKVKVIILVFSKNAKLVMNRDKIDSELQTQKRNFKVRVTSQTNVI